MGSEALIEKDGFTIEKYAKAKHLSVYQLLEYKLQDTAKGISIPYMDEKGNIVATRYRHSLEGATRFSWMKGSKVHPYGLWRLNIAREKGYIVVVEGESDCHTLWQHDIPAIGVPGTQVFRKEWCRYLENLILYLFREPDRGGDVFSTTIINNLKEAHFGSEVYLFNLDKYKDPSNLHVAGNKMFLDRWNTAIHTAQLVKL